VQVLINERVWARLSPEQQAALEDAVHELGDEVRLGVERSEREILERWRASGAIRIVDDVDVDAFRDRARGRFGQGFPFSELYRLVTGATAHGSPAARASGLGRETGEGVP
jgi:TRAP-type transport system periplasmic protein